MTRATTILVADDDGEDRAMIEEAFKEARLKNDIDFVEDGEQLMAYLRREGDYADKAGQALPGFVLLDLNMPRKDGREALQEIKADNKLQHLPVVVLTTSQAEEDIIRTYGLGVNSFISKPVTLEGLVDVIKALSNYWLEIVTVVPE